MDNQTRHIVGLDILRFVAALMVVFLHLWGSTVKGESTVGNVAQAVSSVSPHALRDMGQAAFYLGFLGVPIFFTISGFVIAFSAQRQSVQGYARSRWTRLMPMVWVSSIIGFLVQIIFMNVPILKLTQAFIHSVILLPLAPYIDGVIWTLVIEVFFYGYIALWMILDKGRRFHVYAILLGFLSAIYWVSYFLLGCQGSFGESGSLICSVIQGRWADKIADLLLLTHGGFFAAGILLWWGWAKRRMASAILWAIPAMIAASCQIIISVRHMVRNYSGYGAVDNWPLAVAIWLGGLAWIIVSLRYNHLWMRLPKSVVYSARQAGLATYPLYLIHSLTGGVLLGVAFLVGFGVHTALVLATIGVIILAFVLAIWVEPPVRRVMAIWYDRVLAVLSLRMSALERSRAKYKG